MDGGLEDCGILIADCGIQGCTIWNMRSEQEDVVYDRFD